MFESEDILYFTQSRVPVVPLRGVSLGSQSGVTHTDVQETRSVAMEETFVLLYINKSGLDEETRRLLTLPENGGEILSYDQETWQVTFFAQKLAGDSHARFYRTRSGRIFHYVRNGIEDETLTVVDAAAAALF
jgi:hypothetical protein